MYNILVPVDGSEPSKRAINEALKLTKGREDQYQITLLYVSTSPAYFPIYAEDTTQLVLNVHELERAQGNKLLKTLKDQLHAESDVKVNTKHLLGSPAKEICQFAEKEKVDMIIMGNRGMGAFGKMILGSVSNRVIQEVNVPVLIVK
ncbi:universal stress protein [Terrilactibacillus sp. BCM23-1]|uniref:Universal stress protein n=1 Tax=Terrilactibacillus tamarindi TaxID=2599694 RepID=A0A6N8CL78_9BACI|nr:universal stress protein [Terrilactibacillus tamarindi]MTT30619.1 universal stress protein [Terrilactibacillus tamarindi]